MVDADERCGFGESVALDYGVAETSPELLGGAVEGCSAADKGPELPSELTAHTAEDPPAMKKMFVFCCLKPVPKFLQLALIFQIALNLFLQ